MDVVLDLARQARNIVFASLAAGVLAVGGSFLVKPTFTSTTVLLPPQQQQSMAASALSSLGALASLAGGGGGVRSPMDQYVAFLQGTTVSDRIIERFKLDEVYDEELRSYTRRELQKNVRISGGKRDGLITIEVDDNSPERSREMAAAYVEEFRRIIAEIAVTEAQQRRMFFETHLNQTKRKLVDAQASLQQSGVSGDALKAEPKAVAEGYAKLKAEHTAAMVRLQAMLANLTPNAPEVQQQQSALAALKAQLDKIESSLNKSGGSGSDYINRFREYKYQETLFELFSRQYELARVDESREGGLVQVVDKAQLPDRKSRPKRALIGIGTSLGCGVLLTLFVVLRSRWQRSSTSAEERAKVARIWPALLGRG
jgi:uncharacterized protein involved in exopolysaccharide biosynthesis